MIYWLCVIISDFGRTWFSNQSIRYEVLSINLFRCAWFQTASFALLAAIWVRTNLLFLQNWLGRVIGVVLRIDIWVLVTLSPRCDISDEQLFVAFAWDITISGHMSSRWYLRCSPRCSLWILPRFILRIRIIRIELLITLTRWRLSTLRSIILFLVSLQLHYHIILRLHLLHLLLHLVLHLLHNRLHLNQLEL